MTGLFSLSTYEPDLAASTEARHGLLLRVADGVDAETYMTVYAEQRCEFVEGTVWKIAAIHLRHEMLRDFLRDLFRAYFALTQAGRVLGEPFVMLLPAFPERRREPDLMIVLKEHQAWIKETYLDGPADLVIEIVSPGSVSVDYGDKFVEYERGGVAEYWIIDYHRLNALFYRRDDNGVFQRYEPDADQYNTPLLPGLRLPVSTLWADPLPDLLAVVDSVRAMLAQPPPDEGKV